MEYKFVGPKGWPAITKAVKTAGPRHAAVAFLGSDAPELMPLTLGDVLVTNASDSAVRSHSTSPQAIETYLAAGVEVWSSGALHAKVIATAERAVIGSANASARSSQRANEASVISGTDAMIGWTRAFVIAEKSESEQVTAQDLPRLNALWADGVHQDNDRFGVPGINTSADELVTTSDARFFVCNYDEVDVDEVGRKEMNRIVRRAHSSTNFGTDWLVLEDGDEFRIDDVLFLWDDDGLEAPVVFIDIPRDQADGSRYQAYRYRTDLDWKSWDELEVALDSSIYERLLPDDLYIEGDLSYWNADLARALLDVWDLTAPLPTPRIVYDPELVPAGPASRSDAIPQRAPRFRKVARSEPASHL